MKFLLEAKIPTEKGNNAILDGTLMQKVQNSLENLHPENVYFTVKEGHRTMYAVFEMNSGDQMVSCLEPLWIELGAEINLNPVMTSSDMSKAQPAMEKLRRKS